MTRWAAFDIGSNTVRCLVADCPPGGPIAPIFYQRRVTRLGGGLTAEAGLTAAAMTRTLSALREMVAELQPHQPVACRAVATQAMRMAPNGPEFCQRIAAETGIVVDIIAGSEEAQLSAAGIVSALSPMPSCCLFFDIGGGSTEFGVLVDGRLGYFRSFPIGVVRLCEDYADAPSRQPFIDRILSELQADLQATDAGSALTAAGTVAVGTAGTVTTMAAVDMAMTTYDWRRVNNHRISGERLRTLQEQLAPLTPEERESVPGMEKGRGDLIVPGLQLVLSILRVFGFSALTVSDFGLLEGVVLGLAGRN